MGAKQGAKKHEAAPRGCVTSSHDPIPGVELNDGQVLCNSLQDNFSLYKADKDLGCHCVAGKYRTASFRYCNCNTCRVRDFKDGEMRAKCQGVIDMSTLDHKRTFLFGSDGKICPSEVIQFEYAIEDPMIRMEYTESCSHRSPYDEKRRELDQRYGGIGAAVDAWMFDWN